MSSRELTYRINLSTNDAKRQARNVRATFEAELRTIQVGKLDVSQIQAAVSQAQRLRVEFEQAAVAANRVSQNASNIRPPAVAPTAPPPAASGGIGAGIGGAIVGGAAGYLTIQGLQLISNYVVESAKLDTQIRRTEAAFEFLAGGAAQAEARILALQQASNGTITRLDAMTSSNQIAALGLASTTQEFEELAKAAKIVSTYSSQIKDFNDALVQLGLFSNSSSYQRADQLLIDSGSLVERMRELKAEDSSLTDQQVKLKASVQLLNSEFGPLLDSTVAQASGAEQLAIAWGEFINQKSGISATFNAILGGMAYVVDEMSVVTGFGNSRSILEVTKANAEVAASSAQSFLAPAGAERNAKAFDFTAKLLEKLNKGVKDGIPTALEYRQQVEAIAVAAARFGVVTQSQAEALLDIDSAYRSATASAKVFTNTEELARLNREKMVLDQQVPIESAIAGRAAKAAPVAGVAETIKLYREQKAAVDTAIKQLIDSGVSDQNELAIRVAAITTELLAPFDELEAKASAIDLGAALGNFDQVGTALSSLNAGFTDLLPGVSAARDELTTLSMEMALTGELSDEQAARLEYLSAVAYSVADGGSQLSAVIAELGYDFLESNGYAAELVNQLFLTEAAYRQGAITGDIYAGVTATLTGQLLTLAQGAGIATGAIYALNSAQADMASPAGLTIGGSIANRIQSTQQTSAREQNRREQERYTRDLARSQERSAGRAGKLLEDGAKKASQELKSALDKVPGLFSASQVTEQDMKDTELGVYQEKADEYLRRLRDEVQNGRDWEDVSIEEARAGLERAGLQIGETAEQTLMFLERAINDSSLYSAVENIPIFINEEAVKLTQELQNKSEEGRKNIYEYFGIQVDEAVGAATGGGGAAIEVKPPEFIDIDPLTEGLQTGLDDVVARTGDAVQTALQNAPNAFFDPTSLFGTGSKTGGAMGPMAKPAVTVTADPAAQAWLPVLSGQTPTTITVGVAAQGQPTPSAEKTTLLISDYYEVVAPDGGKVKLSIADYFMFDGAVPVENVSRTDLVTFTGVLPVEQVNRARLVSFLSELPTETIDRAALVGFVNDVSKEEIDRSGLVAFLNSITTEEIDRSTLVGYINGLPTETVDRAELIEFFNALPTETIDRTGLVSFLNAIPTEQVDRAALVSYLNAVATEQVDRSNLVLFAGDLPSITIDLSQVVSFVGDTVKAAQDKIYSLFNFGGAEPIDTAPGITDSGSYAIDIKAQLSDTAYQSYLEYKAAIEANPPTLMPLIQAAPARLGDIEMLDGPTAPTVDVTARITKFDVSAQMDEQAFSSLQGGTNADFMAPLLSSVSGQVSANQDGLQAQGATVAQIIMAGLIAYLKGTQQASGGEQASTPLADALMTNVSTQFGATQNMFYAIGFGPAKSVESGFKGYGYSGLSSGLMDALTNGIRADAENYMQRGATIAGYVQSGMNQQFSAEAGVRSAIAAGAAWGNAFMQGVFEALNGAGFVDQISTQVIDGITGELEQP